MVGEGGIEEEGGVSGSIGGGGCSVSGGDVKGSGSAG